MKDRCVTCARSPRAILWLAVVLVLAAGSLSFASESSVELQSSHFGLEVPVENRRLGEQILPLAESARQTALEQMPSTMCEHVALIWCPTAREFSSRLGGRGGHLLAAASPPRLQIYLNGERLLRLDRGRFRQALVHEFVHIYLGRVVRDPIPRWLDEGLAMYVARQWSLSDAAALSANSLFGGLFSPKQLARDFPREPTAQRRAYRQSYSMTAFLLHLRYPTGGVQDLVSDLAGSPTNGASALRSLLSDPQWLADFDRQWRQRWVRRGRLVLLLTSSGTFWLLVTFLFLAAYARKRRSRRQREIRWAFEEEFSYHDDGFDD
ncbi:hypothetical protein AMJ85_06560 [candidate division BRC1 bacterium SM23_51]|nr:MAG: hypothetical protein AMJ85_06560 [candidate division BRC1 bacterium SM23_51]